MPPEEQLWQENTSLKAKLEQLETQQQFNSNLHSPKVTVAIEQYQLQMSALIVQLEQQQQENARLQQLFQEKEAFWVQSVSENWRTEKQALEHKIAELEKALEQTKSTAVDPSNDVATNKELTWKPNTAPKPTSAKSVDLQVQKSQTADCLTLTAR